MGGVVRHARPLLPAAFRALGSRAERAGPGGADRFPQSAVLLLFHRNLAAGILLPDRPAHHRGDGAVPDERARRTRVVWISVPADGVDRPLSNHRTLDRRRPARAPAARPPAMDARSSGPSRNQAFSLADDRMVDRRRLGALLRGRAEPGQGPRDISGAAHRLCLHRASDVHDLRARRMDARASLRLHVPVAAHSSGADRRIRSQRHLPL